MDNKTIFTKTAKGVGEAVGKTRALSRDLRVVLKEVDGIASFEELLDKISSLTEAKLHEALHKLSTEDYIREFAPPTLESDTLDFITIIPKTEKTERAPGQRTRINEALRLQLEARAKAEVEAYELLEKKQEDRERRGEEAYARREQEKEAARAAQQQAMKEAQETARRESEERARQAIEELAQQALRDAAEAARQEAEAQEKKAMEERNRQEAEQQARLEVEARAKQEAEEKIRRDAEQQAKQALEKQARRQAEEQARRDAEQKARHDAEEQARLIAQQQAFEEAGRQAAREAAEQARKAAETEAQQLAQEQAYLEAQEARRNAEARARREEMEQAVQREAEEQARRDAAEAEEKREAEQRRRKLAAEHRAKRDAEVRARRSLEEQARREAEEQARQHAEEQARLESEERNRQELKQQAEQQALREAEERVRQESEDRARQQAEQKSRRDAEEKAQREAEELADKSAEEEIRREFEALERQQAEAEARKKAEQARRQIEELAQRKAEAKEKKAQEERARRQLEEAEARREAEVQAKQEVERWMREAAQEKSGTNFPEKFNAEPEHESGPDIGTQAVQDEEQLIEQDEREHEEEAQDPIKPAVEKNSFFLRRQNTYRAPVKWRKPVALVVSATIVAGLGLIHVTAFDGKAALFEKAATAQLQQPVKIGKAYLSLLPQPQWRLEDVAIGSNAQITVARIKANVEWSSLYGDEAAFKSLELQSPVFSEQALEWLLFGRSQQGHFAVGRVTASNAKLASKKISLPSFNAAADIGPDGAWSRITIDSLDMKTRLHLRPGGETVQVELSSDSFAMPFGSALRLDEFTAKGTARRSELSISDFSGRVYDGILTGTAKLQWGTNWRMKGNVQAKLMDASQLAPKLLQNGKLAGVAAYALEADHADQLFALPRVEGSFVIQNGTLLGVDFAKFLRSANSAGTSSFADLAGAFVQENGKTQLQKMVLNAGLLSVTGNADMDKSNNLNGRLAVELKSPTQQARSSVALAGTLAEPRFTR